ncbi:MAG TPA: ATP-binding protein [Gammaproteobacteria bacterium]|nr:ATP-binding protein [Gammaproteobacteria bacterium]
MEQPLSNWKLLPDTACPPDHPPRVRLSAQQTGVADSSARYLPYHQVTADDLQRRRCANAALLGAACSHLDWISTLLANFTHTVCLADTDGILLKTVGNWPGADAVGLYPGHDWSEQAMGANGIGSAIATGEPTIVIAEAHVGPPFKARVCMAAPIRDSRGHIIGALDISTPVDEADPDRLLLATHAAAVIEQALDASVRVAQAESLKLLALLSSFTAHELVSPLAALKTILDLLARASLTGEPAAMVAAACHNTERLLQVVEELRILGGSHDRRLQQTDLAELVRSAIVGAGLNGRVELEIALPQQAARIDCNPTLLGRALDNLLRNASDAANTQARIGVQLQDTDSGIRIVVWDTGPGIPPERWHCLFEESFTTKLGGSGLGMLLAKAIVERVHGGHLRFRPNAPSGCRFEIDLPVDKPAPAGFDSLSR